MARTPVNHLSGHRDDRSPSLGEGATSQKVIVSLTATARAYSGKHGLDALLGALQLPADCQAGDMVSIAATGGAHDFSVLRRRWIVEQSGNRLEIVLDHPIRGR